MSTPGMIDLKKLAALARNGDVDTVIAAFPDLYGRLLGKRFDAGFFVETIANNGAGACDYLLTADMEMNPVAGYRLANWVSGYGDVHLVPDLGTLRVATWLDRTALVICDIQREASDGLVPEAPRSVLRRQIERSTELGFTPMAGSELEYYIFRDSFRDADRKRYADLEPAGWYIEDYHMLQGTRVENFNGAARRHLSQSGVPVECTKGEWGLGQHELNVRYCDMLQMADRHAIYKQCLKELADQMDISVTFMAKFAEDRAGSSCHLHVSLWNQSGGEAVNAFTGDQKLGTIDCTDAFRWFLGGWIVHVPEFMVFYGPTVNSYKRYQVGSWAPTRMAWSHDNRTAGFRIVGRGNGLRIESRIPGADCNPYLAYAAALASGLDGIANQIEPPPMFTGDAYTTSDAPEVPKTLREATDLFQQSAFVSAALGEQVVAHYAHFFKTEQRAYDRAVTDWERRRYFERI